jgi:radical SAM protein with 4Fe4S-binding SPASM domain
MALKIKTREERGKLRKSLEENLPFELREMKIHLTGKCNQKCLMCGNWRTPYSEEDLSNDDVKRIIYQAKQLGLRNVKFFGGEPLMYEGFTDLVKYATELGIHSNVVTNGALLTKSLVPEIMRAGLDDMIISIDGPNSKIHDGIRGIPGSFERVVVGISRLYEEKSRNPKDFKISANSIVCQENYRHLAQLFDFCANQGISTITLNPVVSTHRSEYYSDKDSSNENMSLSLSEIAEYNKFIVPELIKKSNLYGFNLSKEKIMIFGESPEDIQSSSEMDFVSRLGTDVCFRPFYYTIIRENGDVLACNRVKGRRYRPIGNIHDSGLSEIWNGEKYQQFRKGVSPISFEDCRRCCYVQGLLNRQIAQEVKDDGK